MPRSAKSASTSRYDKEKRRYHPTARRMTSGSNWRHLNRPEIKRTSDIRPAYHLPARKLQHFRCASPRRSHPYHPGQGPRHAPQVERNRAAKAGSLLRQTRSGEAMAGDVLKTPPFFLGFSGAAGGLFGDHFRKVIGCFDRPTGQGFVTIGPAGQKNQVDFPGLVLA